MVVELCYLSGLYVTTALELLFHFVLFVGQVLMAAVGLFVCLIVWLFCLCLCGFPCLSACFVLFRFRSSVLFVCQFACLLVCLVIVC